MPEQTDPVRRMGRTMWILFWLLALGMAYLFFDGMLAERDNPNRELQGRRGGGQIEVVLKQNRQGHYLAGGSINGVPVTFLLDTGATQVAIPASLAREMGLPRGGRYPVNTANGRVMVTATRINRLTLGPIELTDLDADIVPGMTDATVLLGMNALRRFELLQRGDTLTIRQPAGR